MTPIPEDIPMGWLLALRNTKFGPPSLNHWLARYADYPAIGWFAEHAGHSYHLRFDVRLPEMFLVNRQTLTYTAVAFRSRPTTLAQAHLGRKVPMDPKTPAGIVADWLVEECGVSEAEGVCRLLWWLQELAAGNGGGVEA